MKHGWIRNDAESEGQGKAASNAGSQFETAIGSVYHFVGNFGSIVWMGWLRVKIERYGGSSSGGSSSSVCVCGVRGVGGVGAIFVFFVFSFLFSFLFSSFFLLATSYLPLLSYYQLLVTLLVVFLLC